jgi:hypothetical protein
MVYEQRLIQQVSAKPEIAGHDPILLWDGTFTSNYPDLVKKVQYYILDEEYRINSDTSSNILSILSDSKKNLSEDEYYMLSAHLDKIGLTISAEGKPMCATLLDFEGQKMPVIPIFQNQAVNNAYQKISELEVLRFLKTGSIFACPTIFCYEPGFFNSAGLEQKLIDENNYAKQPKYRSLKSENLRLKSADRTHEIVANYMLSEKNNEFSVSFKYMAYWNHARNKSDKLDLVLKIGESGSREILHIETFCPEMNSRIYNKFNITEPKNLAELTYSVLKKSKFIGSEIKTFKNKKQTGKSSFKGKAPMFDINIDLKKSYSNYNSLIENPIYLGGFYFDYFLNYAVSNMSVLKEIYKHRI